MRRGIYAIATASVAVLWHVFLAISIAFWNFISGTQASSVLLRGHSVMLSEGALTAVLSFNKE